MEKESEQIFFPKRHTNDHWYMKRRSASLITREMQIKSAERFHLSSVRMVILKKMREDIVVLSTQEDWLRVGGWLLPLSCIAQGTR